MDQERKMTVDVIIPTYKPGKKFSRLLTMLEKQTCPVHQIFVVNTEEKYWNKAWEEEFPAIKVHHIHQNEFDHGGTRRMAASWSGADVFICMTDDAVPSDTHLVEQLLAGFHLKGPKGRSRQWYMQGSFRPKTSGEANGMPDCLIILRKAG